MSSKVSILFVHKEGFLGGLVSVATLSYVNHTAIRVGDTVFEMLIDFSSKRKQGELKKVSYAQYREGNLFREYVLEGVEEKKALAWNEENLYRRYDKIRSLLWPLRGLIQLQSSSKWNCTEHACMFLKEFGYDIEYTSNISPLLLEKIFKSKFRKK